MSIVSGIADSTAQLDGVSFAEGAHVLVLGGARELLAARRAGLSFRDSIVVTREDGTFVVASIFRAGLSSTVAEVCVAYGAGALHIDACRVAWGADKPSQDEWNRMGSSGQTTRAHIKQNNDRMRAAYASGMIPVPDGRWPPNMVLSHGRECSRTGTSWSCGPGCFVTALDAQSGELTSGTGAVKRSTAAGYQGNAYGKESRPAGTVMHTYGDTGGASRYFTQVGSYKEAIEWLTTLIGTPGRTPVAL